MSQIVYAVPGFTPQGAEMTDKEAALRLAESNGTAVFAYQKEADGSLTLLGTKTRRGKVVKYGENPMREFTTDGYHPPIRRLGHKGHSVSSRRNPGRPVPDPLMPGIILTFPPPYPGYSGGQLFFPATVYNATKTDIEYTGTGRRGIDTKFVVALYDKYALEDALTAALSATGPVKIEQVTPSGTRIEKELGWLDRASRHGTQSEQHRVDVPQHIRDAAR